jgi:hypothetical protein
MNSYVVCADLWHVVDMQVNSYVVYADLWQVVDMQMNSYAVCADRIARLTLVLPSVPRSHLRKIKYRSSYQKRFHQYNLCLSNTDTWMRFSGLLSNIQYTTAV